ncbi:MAG: hypothetical protein COA79_13045 [Planctomycetota bacterium]|nr:MAG: hypothetical protein COA79_13045 [Planctomycetota bacterium]
MTTNNIQIANKTALFTTQVFLLIFMVSCGSGGGGSTTTPIPTTTTTITVGQLPTKSSSTFSYVSGGQQFSVESVPAGSSVGVAVFRNSATTNESSDLTIGNQQFSKKEISAKILKYSKPLRGQKVKDKMFKFSFTPNDRVKKSSKKSTRVDDPIGTRDSFYHSETKHPTTGERVEELQAFELMYKSSKCLIYSEVNDDTDTTYITLSRSQFIGDAFSTSNSFNSTSEPIFDVVTKTFGSPWGIDSDGNKVGDGGRDGEAPVIILIYNGSFDQSTLGYFYPVDEKEKGFINPSDNYVSNGAEIVYINRFVADDDIDVLGTLAHEFQHLCEFNQKEGVNGTFPVIEFNSDTTNQLISVLFNEGKSVLCEELNGFSLEITSSSTEIGNGFIFNAVNSYFNLISFKKTSSLPNFFAFEGGGDDYGKGYLFWRFIYDTYGAAVVTSASKSSDYAPKSIETATGKDIDVLIQQFQMALMQLNSGSPSDASNKISSIDVTKTYFSTKGVSLGKFDGLTYETGFPGSVIKNDDTYLFKFYKINPVDGKVSFTADNLESASSFSIFTTIINK